MWKRYFGPHARIIGIDMREDCRRYEEDQIDIRIGEQQDTAFLKSVIDEFGVPDIVLDDGSHVMDHISTTFHFLYPQLSKSGIYMVEDLHAAYWSEYGGGFRKKGTFIELCKDLIDELNADHCRDMLASTDFSKTTLSMHFYDSVVVFERGAHTKKFAPRIGVSEPEAESQPWSKRLFGR